MPQQNPPIDPTRWLDYAACLTVDPDLMFPSEVTDEHGQMPAQADVDKALAVCAGCPVMGLCRDAALERRERYGVLGGMSATERCQLFEAEDRAKHAARKRERAAEKRAAAAAA